MAGCIFLQVLSAACQDAIAGSSSYRPHEGFCPMRRLSACTAAILLVAAADGALARDRCSVPIADWQPRRNLQAKLEGEGWTIHKIRPESGCYEASAVDAMGRTVDAFFDPRSLM